MNLKAQKPEKLEAFDFLTTYKIKKVEMDAKFMPKKSSIRIESFTFEVTFDLSIMDLLELKRLKITH